VNADQLSLKRAGLQGRAAGLGRSGLPERPRNTGSRSAVWSPFFID